MTTEESERGDFVATACRPRLKAVNQGERRAHQQHRETNLGPDAAYMEDRRFADLEPKLSHATLPPAQAKQRGRARLTTGISESPPSTASLSTSVEPGAIGPLSAISPERRYAQLVWPA